jgi:hypothetical protein
MKRFFSEMLAAKAGRQRTRPAFGVPATMAVTALSALALAAVRPAAAEPDSAAPLQWNATSDFSGGNYRWSASRGSVDLGLGLETPSRAGLNAASRLQASGPFVQTLPSVSLGLRSADVSNAGWLKQLSGAETAPSTIRRIGIGWKPAESQLMFVREGLGVRLDGDERLTMRLRRGTLSIYMQRSF